MEKILRIESIEKYYGNKSNLTKVLDNMTFDVDDGEFLAIMGASGSGKSTLLNCISTIDRVTSGHIYLRNEDITKLKGNKLTKFRRDSLGFIFQDYNLLDNMTLQDNIALPLSLNGIKSDEVIERTKQIAALFKLSNHLKKYPYQLSGGQKQRGASARALITKPRIIFADEQTGALDSKSSKDLLKSLKYANENENATILMVTHDAFSASYAKQVYMLSDGQIKCRLNHSGSRQKFYDEILSLLVSMGSEQI